MQKGKMIDPYKAGVGLYILYRLSHPTKPTKTVKGAALRKMLESKYGSVQKGLAALKNNGYQIERADA